MPEQPEPANGSRVTQAQLFDSIATLRVEMQDSFDRLEQRIDSFNDKHPTSHEMTACLQALEAELHGKIGESQADRQLIRKELDGMRDDIADHDKQLQRLRGMGIVAALLMPLISGAVVALIAHYIGT